jgi:hypothetical protein
LQGKPSFFDKRRMRAIGRAVEILILSPSKPVLSDAAGAVEGNEDFGPTPFHSTADAGAP